MYIKKKIVISLVVLLTLVIYATIKGKNNSSVQKNNLNEWFDGWTKDLISVRKSYSKKRKSIIIKDLGAEAEFLSIDSMRKCKKSLEECLNVELWNIDNVLQISNKWYDKIDPMLKNSLNDNEINLLKKNIKTGVIEAGNFKQTTIQYFNSQLSFVKFLLDKNCNLTYADETMYNILYRNMGDSFLRYNKEVNDMKSKNFKRLQEFNEAFKNKNINSLINAINNNSKK